MNKWFFFFRAIEKDSIYETKIKSQIEALNQLGIDVEFPQYVALCKKKIKVTLTKNNEKFYFYKYGSHNQILKKIDKISNLFKHEWLYMKSAKYIRNNRIDVFYNRKHYLTPIDIIVYHSMRHSVKKIVLEIPTYPYEGEIKNHLILFMDKLIRNIIKRYIDFIVVPSNEYKEIWGVKCINIQNGVDLKKIRLVESQKNTNEIVFTQVSGISAYHGIDKFLYSISNYIENEINNKYDLKFNIVGVGECTEELIDLVNKLNLSNIVTFKGFTMGEELDQIFNKTNIAIGSLAMHRIELMTAQPLKNREYAARGLPFIIGFNDPTFKDMNYVYHVSNDESLINIAEVIEWYIRGNFKSQEIRESVNDISWENQMKIILNTINI